MAGTVAPAVEARPEAAPQVMASVALTAFWSCQARIGRSLLRLHQYGPTVTVAVAPVPRPPEKLTVGVPQLDCQRAFGNAIEATCPPPSSVVVVVTLLVPSLKVAVGAE